MARAPSKRVVLNLRALDQLQFAVAVGLGHLAEQTLEAARPRIPGASIAKTEGWAVFNGSRKVGGPASKPRSFDTRRKGIISAVVGYGSPLAHLHERGTVGRVQHSTTASPPDEQRFTGALPARPFLLPATVATVRDIGPVIGRAIAEVGLGKP